jgi:FG-GAP-like repeat
MSRFVRVLSLSSFLVVSTILASAQINFTQTIIPSGDSSSNGIVAGDFNNDGILDLVTVNGRSLSFYKGLGGGQYANPISQPLQFNVGQVVAADFSRHGTPDLAILPLHTGTVFFFGGVDIMIGNNNGTFKPGERIDVGGAAMSIALADFNGDHLPDLAVSACSAPVTPPCNTQIFLGRGDGTFKLATTLPDGGGAIVAGDFNADGHQDFAVVAGNEIALYLGKGNGTFESPILASLIDVVSMAVGDFYSNRIQSLVALTSTPVSGGNFKTQLFTLRFSGGHLLVQNQLLLQDSASVVYQQVAAGDLNGDFKDDVFLVGVAPPTSGGQLAGYLLGNGNGTFVGPLEVPTFEDPVFPFIRDLNGDSRHDVALAWTEFSNTGGAPNDGGAEILHNTNATTNCSLPPANQLVVHICAPAHNGQIVGQTFTFRGSGSAFNGIAKRMELWIDGHKVAQNLEDQLKATVKLTRGNHIASFVVVDSFDNHTAGSVSFKAQF